MEPNPFIQTVIDFLSLLVALIALRVAQDNAIGDRQGNAKEGSNAIGDQQDNAKEDSEEK